ncbi:MAG TPA: uracil-DNA glycosylase [Burkholderiaceae bacterium]|nr:uracil-DNA glycosylase [Burkholderiaceae bacterium]
MTVLQQAWLQEIGLDRRMLARYAAVGQADAVPAPPPGKGASTLSGASAAVASQASARPAASTVPPAVRAGLTRAAQLIPAAVPSTLPLVNPAVTSPADAASATSRPATSVPSTWEALQAHIATCDACALHASRGRAVFGTGATQRPAWMIIGEAPGNQDDRVGLPFQGRAGVLLQAMLASVGVLPDTPVFYTNIVKCRPLGNRPPEPDEIAACMPFLRRQIDLLQPQRILTLGRLAAQALLGVDADLEAMRQKVHHVRDDSGRLVPMVATYHPASLLLRAHHKADAWADLNLARSVLSA